MPKKRKDVSPPTSTPAAKKQELCIIHIPGIKHGSFTFFPNDPKERLKIFHVLQNVRDRRMAEPVTSAYRMQDTCQGIPDEVNDKQGYHRGCYQRFTGNLNRLTKNIDEVPSTSGVSASRPKRKAGMEQIIFEPDCIFCNKTSRIHLRKAGADTTEATASFERDGWQNVLHVAEQNNHEWLLRRIRGYDLFACEAKYHPKCRRQYIANPKSWRSSDFEATAEQSELEAAHDYSFRHVAKYIDETVVHGCKVVTLSSLRLMYIAKLDETRFANSNFRSEKLKRKLEKHPTLGPKLVFTKVQPQQSKVWPFYLVYSSSISVDEAVTAAYQLASKDAIKDVALLLRGIIQRAFKESEDLSWPPSMSSLEVTDEVIPAALKRFLSLVISAVPTAASDRTERVIFSIGQDICRAVTNGEWKLPKHILLCMTLRHLYRSRQLVTLLNRLGHCENYLFSVELETAVAAALDQTSSILTPRIVKSPENVVFHSEWDNFNQLLTGLHGRPAFNTAAGIMLQEAERSERTQTHINPISVSRTRERTLKLNSPPPLPPFHISNRKGPDMELPIVHQSHDNMTALLQGLKVYLIWAFCRKASSTDKQQVPALGGFISATGLPPRELTTIDFYPSITEPITQDNVVKELLRQCEKATQEVGQLYTITTFDLGVVMKAMPLIWSRPTAYKNHIILIGTFHTIMNYLNMLGHKMAGSGYSEIIIEANLTTSGCLKGVLNGKAYSKSLWCLKVVSEALERLLFAAYISQRDESAHGPTNADAVDALIKQCNPEHLEAALNDKTINEYLFDYMAFQERVRDGELGKTAIFWMSFLDHARRVFMLLYAVKTNNFNLYHKCMGDMADLFFAFGGMNYSRYLAWFDVFLANIEVSHPGATQLLEKGAISVARSKIPGNLCAVDKTMEETFMKFAKSRCGAGGAGLTGILENYGAYQRWIRTTSERTKYYQATLEMTGMSNETDSSKSGKHREQLPSEVKRSEAAVQRVIEAMQGFLNPFEVADREHMYILSSGNPVPSDIENDVLSAEEAGRLERDKFVSERLQKRQ